MLSTFESVLLDRHLGRCADCRAFAVDAGQQTRLLRAAPLEQPTRTVVLPERPARRGVGAFVALAGTAAVAAIVSISPGTGGPAGTPGAVATARASVPSLAVFSATPTTSSRIDVPRLRVQAASFADGPVHGLFRLPA
jgi:hypothetical protein